MVVLIIFLLAPAIQQVIVWTELGVARGATLGRLRGRKPDRETRLGSRRTTSISKGK